VIRTPVQFDGEPVLGPEAIDLPDVDVDVVQRLGDLRMLGQQTVKGQLQLGLVVLDAAVAREHRRELGHPRMTVVARQRRLQRGEPIPGVGTQQALLDGHSNQTLELGRGLAPGQLHEHARDGADAELVPEPHIILMGLVPRAVDSYALPAPSAPGRQRHLYVVDVDEPHPPDGRGCPMAEKRAWPEAQEGTEEVRASAHPGIADREHVVMDRVQPAVADHAADLVVAESELPQLLSRDHSVLAGDRRGQPLLTWLTNVC
jgi:hypothetical protein